MTATQDGVHVSAREMLLLAMLARGHTTERAARELRLSRYTVGEEISVLLERFNCRNRAELVAYCYVHSLLPIGIWPPPYGQPEEHPGQAATGYWTSGHYLRGD
jgi:DNA-binding CsgD family transcriptional regulator